MGMKEILLSVAIFSLAIVAFFGLAMDLGNNLGTTVVTDGTGGSINLTKYNSTFSRIGGLGDDIDTKLRTQEVSITSDIDVLASTSIGAVKLLTSVPTMVVGILFDAVNIFHFPEWVTQFFLFGIILSIIVLLLAGILKIVL